MSWLQPQGLPRGAEKSKYPPMAENERKVWHPVVWQQPPPPVEEVATGANAPHKRIIRNIYRFFKETEGKEDVRKKHIEDMLLALPSGSRT